MIIYASTKGAFKFVWPLAKKSDIKPPFFVPLDSPLNLSLVADTVFYFRLGFCHNFGTIFFCSLILQFY